MLLRHDADALVEARQEKEEAPASAAASGEADHNCLQPGVTLTSPTDKMSHLRRFRMGRRTKLVSVAILLEPFARIREIS